jgi:iron complex transport system substrate-binding protein
MTAAGTPTHRRPLLAGVLLLLASSLLACGDDDPSDDGDGTDPAAETDGGSGGGDDGNGDDDGEFPATVEHAHGSTEVEAAPERIVTVGLSDHDFVLAFGVSPIAVTDWYGDHPAATWEWAQDELGDAEPAVLNQGAFTGEAAYDYEEIAALDPDLIIGLYTDMDEDQYSTLSEIAPTIAPSADHPAYGMPWQETTRMVGAALGRPERAEELIEEVEGKFAEAAAAHPEFEGVEAVVAEVFEPGKTFVRSATDPRTTFMTSLGFVLPEDLAELAGEKDGADISDEQMSLLDRDLLLWNVGWEPELRADIEDKPLYDSLDVVRDGRSVFIEDGLISGALTWGTVLSLPYAIDELVPQLAAVFEG